MPEAAVISHKAVHTSQLKIVEKALELPIVSDALSEVPKINSPYLNNIVTQGFEIFTPTVEFLQNKAVEIIPEDASIYTAVDAAKVKISAVIEDMDTMACSRLDELTSKFPSLRSNTPDLVESIKLSSRPHLEGAKDYLASFSISQNFLKATDKSLQYTDEVFKLAGIRESKKFQPVTSGNRSIRRDARALRRNGLKVRNTSSFQNVDGNFLGIALLHTVIFFLSFVGMQLSTFSEENRRDRDTPISDIMEGKTQDLLSDEKLVDYDSEFDEDYVPDESTDSSGSETDGDDENVEALREEVKAICIINDIVEDSIGTIVVYGDDTENSDSDHDVDEYSDQLKNEILEAKSFDESVNDALEAGRW